MTSTDNTVVEITEADIVQSGLSINRYSATGRNIEVGSTVAAELSLTLFNGDGRFDNTYFEGATLKVDIGIKKWDARNWENAKLYYVPMGIFKVEGCPRKLSTIEIKAMDNMIKFDSVADFTDISFPMSTNLLLDAVCTKCGVERASKTLDNGTYSVTQAPKGDSITYRQLVGWIAQIAGTCAFIDWDGKLRLAWYTTTTESISESTCFSKSFQEKNVTIDAVDIIADSSEAGQYGGDYPLQIIANKLIQHDSASLGDLIRAKLMGFTYLPFEATIISLPYLYPLDVISYEAASKTFPLAITDVTFTINQGLKISGRGETATQRKDGRTPIPFTPEFELVFNLLSSISMTKFVDKRMNNSISAITTEKLTEILV